MSRPTAAGSYHSKRFRCPPAAAGRDDTAALLKMRIAGSAGTGRVAPAAGKSLPSPAERERYLAEACGEDLEPRPEAKSLLAANSAAGEFLLHPVAVGIGAGQRAILLPPLSELAGTRSGRFELLAQIGEGCFGAVWMARRFSLPPSNPAMATAKISTNCPSPFPATTVPRKQTPCLAHT